MKTNQFIKSVFLGFILTLVLSLLNNATAQVRKRFGHIENKFDRREDVRDRRENFRDRLEDVWYIRHHGGRRDRLEDMRDRREDIRDLKEDFRDRRENIRTHRLVRWYRCH